MIKSECFSVSGTKQKGDDTVQVTWDNPDELEAYIKKLQAAADRLTSENRRLRKCHHTVQEKVGHHRVYLWWSLLGLLS